MRVGEKLGSQAALRNQAVDIGRRRPADNDVKSLVFKNHQEDVGSHQLRRFERDGVRWPGLHDHPSAAEQS